MYGVLRALSNTRSNYKLAYSNMDTETPNRAAYLAWCWRMSQLIIKVTYGDYAISIGSLCNGPMKLFVTCSPSNAIKLSDFAPVERTVIVLALLAANSDCLCLPGSCPNYVVREAG